MCVWLPQCFSFISWKNPKQFQNQLNCFNMCVMNLFIAASEKEAPAVDFKFLLLLSHTHPPSVPGRKYCWFPFVGVSLSYPFSSLLAHSVITFYKSLEAAPSSGLAEYHSYQAKQTIIPLSLHLFLVCCIHVGIEISCRDTIYSK